MFMEAPESNSAQHLLAAQDRVVPRGILVTLSISEEFRGSVAAVQGFLRLPPNPFSWAARLQSPSCETEPTITHLRRCLARKQEILDRNNTNNPAPSAKARKAAITCMGCE